MIQKYSCSYGGTKENFVILNVHSKVQTEIPREVKGILCVVRNILQRGGMNTIPSVFLEQKIGRIDGKVPFHLMENEIPDWTNTIKGDETSGDYPALEFFSNILPKVLGDDAFAVNMFLPEADLRDILGDDVGARFTGQQVDFYVPSLGLVIEIDGSGHEKDFQKKKDLLRDEALRKAGIEVMRIRTSDIRQQTNEFAEQLEEIKRRIEACPLIAEYRRDLKNIQNDSIQVRLDVVMRLQMLILDCIEIKQFDWKQKQWKIFIRNSDVKKLENLFKIAIQDIRYWVENIAGLLKYPIVEHELVFVNCEQEADLILDFSMRKRYTDTHVLNPRCVFVRNDYFTQRDYFKISTADMLKYNIDKENNGEDIQRLNFILRNIFGFDSFREGQLPIVINILERNDTIGILPTGTGKSLCYMFSAILQPGVTIVIAPIIALMVDQKRSMDNAGIVHTGYISSQYGGAEKDRIMKALARGTFQLLWVSPERFQNEEFRNSIATVNRKMNFAMMVLDEVHCLSEWGHDFRVSYLALTKTLRVFCPEACLLGLTATASQIVLEDIKNEFGNDGSGVKALPSMNRDELVFKRMYARGQQKIKVIDQIIHDLSRILKRDVLTAEKKRTIGLIFTPTVKGYLGCNDVAGRLAAFPEMRGRIGVYNGQLSSEERLNVQERFMRDEYAVLVCTKAFGMGIDKPNIKYTIHYALPGSIESFYQEAGRAGRDADKSEKSYCYIIYGEDSISDSIEKEIFSADISPDHRKELCDQYLRNDLNSIMFLWNLNKRSVNEEYEQIRKILMVLNKNGKGTVKLYFNSAAQKTDIENSLYKLSVLGIVESWTVNYLKADYGELKVAYQGYDEADMEKSLLYYIHKYDPEFSLTNASERYRKYAMLIKGDTKRGRGLIKILIEWTNENILYQRLQSTYNMKELCSPKVSDEEFRRRIDFYFRYTEKTILFDAVAANPLKFEKWFEILYEKDTETLERGSAIDRRKGEELMASLQRYLESFRYNTGLNYLSGMLRLFCGNYQNSEGERRLKEAFEVIVTLPGASQRKIFMETLNFARAFQPEEKEILSELLLRYYPERSKDVYQELGDNYSLAMGLESISKHFNQKMKEKVKWII